MAIDLFCYGSLMFDPVWTRVVQGGYPAQPARLRGWRRGAVIGEEVRQSSALHSSYGKDRLPVVPHEL